VRAGLILFALAVAILFLIPSLLGTLPPWWAKVFPTERIHLGLDLQGGISLLLEVDVEKAISSALDKYVMEIKEALKKENLPFLQVERSSLGRITAVLPDRGANSGFGQIHSEPFSRLQVASFGAGEGLFLYDLELNSTDAQAIKDFAVRQELETIRKRIDQFGVNEPVIARQGENQILVQLPGVKDPKRAIDLIGRTATVEFKLVDDDHNLEEALKGNLPSGDEILYQKEMDKVGGESTHHPFLLKKAPLMTGEVISSARVRIKSEFNETYIKVDFTEQGARLFDQITAAYVGKRIAVVLDDNVYATPMIHERIHNGQVNITGGELTPEEASELAIALRVGALPAPVRIIQNVTVGPILGQDSIGKGTRAAAIGALLIVVFMAVYYGLAGLIADWALALNILYLLGAMAGMGATLTLPGIAGVILTIGMAVDSNVLMFERIREELRLGKMIRTAVDSGYDKALFTIIDSHLTTLITAIALFQFGAGPIKGFAVTLSLGVMINLFSSLIGTKVIFDWMNMRKQLKTLSL